jgi:hypothetical protein
MDRDEDGAVGGGDGTGARRREDGDRDGGRARRGGTPPPPYIARDPMNDLAQALERLVDLRTEERAERQARGRRGRDRGNRAMYEGGFDEEDEERPRYKIDVPLFKGEPKEKPEPHWLRAVDWMDYNDIHHDDRVDAFKHTLSGKAREWYEDIVHNVDWPQLEAKFKKKFSLQGQSQKFLNDRWRSFAYTPGQDIEKFLDDVKETGHQLEYPERNILTTIKTCMPNSIYGSISRIDDIGELCEILLEIYGTAKKPADPVALASTTSPFSHMSVSRGNSQIRDIGYDEPDVAVERAAKRLLEKSVRFETNQNVEHKLDKMTKAFAKYAQVTEELLEEKQRTPETPYKPYITTSRGRGRGRRAVGFDRQNDRSRSFTPNRYGRGRYNGPYRGGYSRNSRSFSPYRRGRGNFRFDRSPNIRRSRSSSRPINKDKLRCFRCRNFGHFQNECPENQEEEPQDDAPVSTTSNGGNQNNAAYSRMSSGDENPLNPFMWIHQGEDLNN